MDAGILPDEVWEHIFVCATEVYGAFDPIPDPFAYPGPSSNVALDTMRSYKTMRSLIATCRRWNCIALPLLYRNVVMRNKASYQRLERTTTDNPMLMHAMLTHTWRLELPSCFSREEILHQMLLKNLLASLPNLRILVLGLGDEKSGWRPWDLEDIFR